MVENGLSLRYYVELLLRERKWIILWVIVACLGAIATTFLSPRTYEAEGTVTILRSRTEVEFDPRIRTLSDYELANAGTTARQDALVALVTGNQVVQRVLDDVGEHLDPEQRNVTDLRRMVQTATTGDLININVQHRDPEVAALIANSWAQHYEQYVNSVYSTSPVADSNTANQVATAEQRYNAAQEALEAFTAGEQILTLEREIASREALLQSYQQTLNRVHVSPTDTSQALLFDYYRELQQIENWLAAANSLREQVSRDSNSPAAEIGNTVALLMLRSRIFGGEGSTTATGGVVNEGQTGTESASSIRESASGPELTLQLDLSSPPESGITTADVDAVIEVLEQRREDVQGRIDGLVESINSGSIAQETPSTESQLVAQASTLENEIAVLQSEVEAQTARRRELEQVRDTAWDTYQVLLGRQREQEIVSESPAAEVRIADTTVVPTEPMSRGLIRNTVLAGLAAVMLSVGAITAWDWWKSGDVEFAEPDHSEIPPGSADSDYPERAAAPSTAPGHSGQLPDSVT